jgi:general secretion pathway protein J
MMSRLSRGFTLVEVVLALSLVAALLAIAFAGLRVGLGAWRQGEERAQQHQHTRGLTQLLVSAVEGTYVYQAAATSAEPAQLLFDGDTERLAFATAAPPLAGPTPITFTAVVISQEVGPPPRLVLWQKALPNHKPFDGMTAVLVDGAITALRFRYLRLDGHIWEDSWDATKEKALPQAVEITVTTDWNGRRLEQPPLTVPLPVTMP